MLDHTKPHVEKVLYIL